MKSERDHCSSSLTIRAVKQLIYRLQDQLRDRHNKSIQFPTSFSVGNIGIVDVTHNIIEAVHS